MKICHPKKHRLESSDSGRSSNFHGLFLTKRETDFYRAGHPGFQAKIFPSRSCGNFPRKNHPRENQSNTILLGVYQNPPALGSAQVFSKRTQHQKSIVMLPNRSITETKPSAS
jgi:hypothetical protein